jgi:ribonuclease E
MPNRAKTIKLYSGERPLFNKYNLEEQIERIYKRRVPLPSGGEIVIDGTEALTAVDVNSARTKRQGDIEENILQTNLEASAEIGRQLRLRDLGGLIVIDFIDMASTRNKKKVEKAMREALRGDRARHDLTAISKLGLMELARQRIKGTKLAASYATCVVCDGHGLIKNVEAAALAALRKLQTRSARGEFGTLRVGLPAEVATWLLNNKREELLRLEQRHQISIEVAPGTTLLRHECTFETVAREKREEPPAKAAAEVLPAPPPAVAPPAPSEPAEPRTAGSAPQAAAQGQAPAGEARGDEQRPEPRTGAATGEKGAAASEDGGEPAADKPRRRRRKKRRPRSTGAAGADPAQEQRGGDDRARAPRGEPAQEQRGGDDKARAPRSEPAREQRGGDDKARAPRSEPAREASVPRHIRSDELMPAASGGSAAGSRKRGNASPSTRKRKKSSARGSRRSRPRAEARASAGGTRSGDTTEN